jgi:hypothetical protein
MQYLLAQILKTLFGENMEELECWVWPYRSTDDVEGEKYSRETLHMLVIWQPVQLIQNFDGDISHCKSFTVRIFLHVCDYPFKT